ncbi:MAG: hypothetical protein ACLT8E_00050 [Akkermansia sp.]
MGTWAPRWTPCWEWWKRKGFRPPGRLLKRHAKDVKDMNAYMDGNDKESPIRPEQVTTAVNKHAARTPCTGTRAPLTGSARAHAAEKRWLPSITAPWRMPCRWRSGPRRRTEPPGSRPGGDGGLSRSLGTSLICAQPAGEAGGVHNDCLTSSNCPQAGLIPWQINLNNPSFAAVADAVGIKGFLLDKSSQVDQMVNMFLNYPGAALLDAHVDRDALALPPYISMGQAADFSLAMMKQTLAGEVKQVWNTLAGNRKLFKP